LKLFLRWKLKMMMKTFNKSRFYKNHLKMKKLKNPKLRT
jgi:hypothetical protein